MPEITDYRITGLKTSIHSLRLRIGFLWSYINKQNKEKFETYYLDNSIKVQYEVVKSESMFLTLLFCNQ